MQGVAGRLTGDQWLIALGGWNEEQFTDAEPRFTLAELDAIAGGRPAFLQAQYDHAFVNSAFLRHFGIDPAAPRGVTGAAETELDPEALARPGPQSGAGAAALSGLLEPNVERGPDGAATGYLSGGMPMVIPVTGALPALTEAELIDGVRKAAGVLQLPGPDHHLRPGRGPDYRGSVPVGGGTARGERVDDPGFSHPPVHAGKPGASRRAAQQIAQMPPMLNGDHYYDTMAIGEAFYIPVQIVDGLDDRRPKPTNMPSRCGYCSRAC